MNDSDVQVAFIVGVAVVLLAITIGLFSVGAQLTIPGPTKQAVCSGGRG